MVMELLARPLDWKGITVLSMMARVFYGPDIVWHLAAILMLKEQTNKKSHAFRTVTQL